MEDVHPKLHQVPCLPPSLQTPHTHTHKTHTHTNYNQDFKVIVLIFSSPVQKCRKSYCITPGISDGVGAGGGGGVNKNVKVLRQSF